MQYCQRQSTLKAHAVCCGRYWLCAVLDLSAAHLLRGLSTRPTSPCHRGATAAREKGARIACATSAIRKRRVHPVQLDASCQVRDGWLLPHGDVQRAVLRAWYRRARCVARCPRAVTICHVTRAAVPTHNAPQYVANQLTEMVPVDRMIAQITAFAAASVSERGSSAAQRSPLALLHRRGGDRWLRSRATPHFRHCSAGTCTCVCRAYYLTTPPSLRTLTLSRAHSTRALGRKTRPCSSIT